MIPTELEFLESIQISFPEMGKESASRAAQFAFYLHTENEAQNLTRITGVIPFIEDHLRDVVSLLSLKDLGSRVVDLGSGSGVPGLLAACIDVRTDREWILVESEGSKARFLEETAAKIGLKQVKVYSARIESVIQTINPDTVTARAVGTVEKICTWIWNCSTWNNLILFKSRAWNEEWDKAQRNRLGKKLTINQIYDYSFGTEKTRILVSLKRKKMNG